MLFRKARCTWDFSMFDFLFTDLFLEGYFGKIDERRVMVVLNTENV